ncbi:hypothetical protein M9H77_08299 [Catharanthus roseus]|uniref:Uncharacterized protein n=1 Tax=Catharanthus roseus TaxID=4058 RepID=A0ACC0BXK2_CATRO|nr:hypothetical protein M9H77_08299 [Catharanthus roseus]
MEKIAKLLAMDHFLAGAGVYENQKEASKRVEVLGRLDEEWVKNVSRTKGFNEQMVQEASTKIFTFGFYHLGFLFLSLPNLLNEMAMKFCFGHLSDIAVSGHRFCAIVLVKMSKKFRRLSSLDIQFSLGSLTIEKNRDRWTSLFEPVAFFNAYRNYSGY